MPAPRRIIAEASTDPLDGPPWPPVTTASGLMADHIWSGLIRVAIGTLRVANRLTFGLLAGRDF